MIRSISLAYHSLPLELILRHDLGGRVYDRGGEREVQFRWSHLPRLLPVWDEGRLRLVAWGCRRGESRRLPPCGTTWAATVEAGGWGGQAHRPVDVPASLLCDGQVWTLIREG